RCASVGNHEYETVDTTPGGWGTDCSDAHDAAGYFKYFGGVAGNPLRGYYSFNVGAWHLVALHSNCDFVSCAPGSTQERWLRNDLADHPAACTLALWHHPRFSSSMGEASS